MRYGFVRYYERSVRVFGHDDLLSLRLEDDETIVSVETLQNGSSNGRSVVRIWIARQAGATSHSSANGFDGVAVPMHSDPPATSR